MLHYKYILRGLAGVAAKEGEGGCGDRFCDEPDILASPNISLQINGMGIDGLSCDEYP